MSTNEIEKNVLFSESPASWNTKYLSPDGYVCQFTLRADNGTKLLEMANLALVHLKESGCIPYYYGNGPQSSQNTKENKANNNEFKGSPAWCPIHECEMQLWEKEGNIWYSHKINGEWCKGA